MDRLAYVQFEFGREDYLHLARTMSFRGTSGLAWRKFRTSRRWMLAGSVALTLIYASALASNFKGAIDPGNVVILSVGGVVAYMWWWTVGAYRQGTNSSIEQRFQAFADRDEVRRSFGPTSVTVYSAAMVWESAVASVVQPWAQLAGIEETPELILLLRDENAAYAVPRRAFRSPGQASEFADLCRKLYTESPRDPAVDVQRFLSDRDVPCPGCGYNLRALRSQSCPECGFAFTLPGLVRAAHNREQQGAAPVS